MSGGRAPREYPLFLPHPVPGAGAGVGWICRAGTDVRGQGWGQGQVGQGRVRGVGVPAKAGATAHTPGEDGTDMSTSCTSPLSTILPESAWSRVQECRARREPAMHFSKCGVGRVDVWQDEGWSGSKKNNETRNVHVPFLAASSTCWQSSVVVVHKVAEHNRVRSGAGRRREMTRRRCGSGRQGAGLLVLEGGGRYLEGSELELSHVPLRQGRVCGRGGVRKITREIWSTNRDECESGRWTRRVSSGRLSIRPRGSKGERRRRRDSRKKRTRAERERSTGLRAAQRSSAGRRQTLRRARASGTGCGSSGGWFEDAGQRNRLKDTIAGGKDWRCTEECRPFGLGSFEKSIGA
ncbi:hypothetical protein B0H14DRAFT_3586241 [Mycena olivaceomarginata]|nr:hypothetical protein B0H14DRAFT_3586241 [Mycena olivaceomarginata]